MTPPYRAGWTQRDDSWPTCRGSNDTRTASLSCQIHGPEQPGTKHAGDGQKAVATELKNARYALWKNPDDLTARHGAKLASIAKTNHHPYRAYLLKEQLRQVFALAALTHGLSNARVESVNTKLRLLTRIAFGYRSPEALVALANARPRRALPPAPRPRRP